MSTLKMQLMSTWAFPSKTVFLRTLSHLSDSLASLPPYVRTVVAAPWHMCSIVYAVQAGFKGWAMSQDGPLPRTGRLPSLPTTSLTVQVQFWRGLTHLLVRIGLRGYITLNRLCDSKCQHAIMQSVSQVVPRYTYVARLPPRSAPFGCNEAARNLKSEQVKLSREHVAGVYSAFFATLFRRIDEKVKTLTSPKGSPRSVPGRPLVVRERPRIKTSTANARDRKENLQVTNLVRGQILPKNFEWLFFLVVHTGKLQPVLLWREKPVLLALPSNLGIPIPASYPVFHTKWSEISWAIF